MNIVRNLTISKVEPSRPRRGCRYSAGPELSSRIATRDRAQQRRQQNQRAARDDDVERALQQPRAAAEPHRRQRDDRHPLDVVQDRVRGEDLEVARHDRDLDVRTPHGPDEVQGLFVRANRGREQHAVDLELVDDVRDVVGAPEHRRRQRLLGVAVEEADDLEAVLGMRRDLAEDEQSPPRRFRRSSVRRGFITRGKIQLRIEPRTIGTVTSAAARNSTASAGAETHQPKKNLTPCERIRYASEPARIAWKRSRTSSKLETEILRLSFSYRW